MDQKPFSHNQPALPRIRVRSLFMFAILAFMMFCVYGPVPARVPDPSSPVYLHDRRVKHWPGWAGLRHIFFFGDSYTSTRFLPRNAAPSLENPFGNPPFPGNVSHKRPLWSDYVVGTYNQSFITAINLAWGGATVDDRLIIPFIDIIEGLNRQVEGNYMNKYAAEPRLSFPWGSKDSLFVFWFGINDVNGAWWWENRTEVWKQDLTTYAQKVEQVYQTGARNFLFFNIPPVERSPEISSKGLDVQTQVRGDVANWNNEVFRLVNEFTRLHNDTTTFWWDAFKSYSEVLDNPCSHRETCTLKDVTSNCVEYSRLLGMEVLRDWEQNEPACPHALKEYFWMDNLHHGYHMHDVTAQAVVKMMRAEPKNDFIA